MQGRRSMYIELGMHTRKQLKVTCNDLNVSSRLHLSHTHTDIFKPSATLCYTQNTQ